MPPSRPPFRVTPAVVDACGEIMRLIGRYEGLLRPSPQLRLRRHNRARAVRSSLAIEGNPMTLPAVAARLDGRPVPGPPRHLREVDNALAAYQLAPSLDPGRERDLLHAHRVLMQGLVADAGRYRARNVGVLAGTRVAHLAPPHRLVPRLARDLLAFLRRDRATHPLVLSAVAHYELEFIHPFSDGNGRLGRLWQHVVLVRFDPVFEFVPVESIVHDRQQAYYRTLRACDRAGDSTAFVEFSLGAIRAALAATLDALRPEPSTPTRRLTQARSAFGARTFSRKDYLDHFKTLSTATASRDLAAGVAAGTLARKGDRARARYRFRGRR